MKSDKNKLKSDLTLDPNNSKIEQLLPCVKTSLPPKAAKLLDPNNSKIRSITFFSNKNRIQIISLAFNVQFR